MTTHREALARLVQAIHATRLALAELRRKQIEMGDALRAQHDELRALADAADRLVMEEESR